MKIGMTTLALTAALALSAGAPAPGGSGPDHKDLVSPFGAQGQHRDGASPRISGRDHAEHLRSQRPTNDDLKRAIRHEHRKDHVDHKAAHRDHLIREKHGHGSFNIRIGHDRHDRVKRRLFDHDRYRDWRHRDHRYDWRHGHHPAGCGCSVCVKTTKIVIAPQPRVVERRTVIHRPVVEREVVYAPRASAWSLLTDWRFERALDAFGDRASRDRHSGEHRVGYALAAYGLGETDLAATAFRRAIEIDPFVMTAFAPSHRLERLVRELEDRLSERILHGELTSGQLIVADLDEEADAVTFRAVESPEAPDTPPVELAGGGDHDEHGNNNGHEE